MGTQKKIIKVCFVFDPDLLKKGVLTVASELAGLLFDHTGYSQDKQRFPKIQVGD